jgi:hypothetical protein
MTRIEQIYKEIEKLNVEKEQLLEIERLPKIQRIVAMYIKSTYTGKRLLEKHSLEEEGYWKILGEDPNCDLGGYHHQPDLGTYSGTLQKVLEIAVQHSNWAAWGGGGDIVKVNVKHV